MPFIQFFQKTGHYAVSSISLWSVTLWSMIFCFRSSSRDAIQAGVLKPKIMPLHCDGLFDGSFKLFFFFFLTTTSCSFIISFVTHKQVTKSFFGLLFYTSENPSSSSACCIAGFLHRYIYTLQHAPEDDNCYLVCK